MSRGTILMPERLSKNFVCDRYKLLMEKLADDLQWKIVFDDNFNVDKMYGNTLLSVRVLQGSDIIHGLHNNWKTLTGLTEEFKLITYYSDLHMLQPNLESIYKQSMMGVLGRSNLILTAYWHPFCEQYPFFAHKAIHFPQFFPTERYDFEPNPQALLQCLTCGVSNKIYDLREFMLNYETVNKTGFIKHLSHPGYGDKVKTTPKYKVKDAYAQELYKYFCGFADCTSMQYVVGKYYEIPAAGSLLLARYAKDLEKLGFKHGVNMLKVNSKNMFDYIYDILNNPSKYEHIRQAGHKFVHDNHSMDHRLKQLKSIIKNVTNKQELS